jgi:hypothetical protein
MQHHNPITFNNSNNSINANINQDFNSDFHSDVNIDTINLHLIPTHFRGPMLPFTHLGNGEIFYDHGIDINTLQDTTREYDNISILSFIKYFTSSGIMHNIINTHAFIPYLFYSLYTPFNWFHMVVVLLFPFSQYLIYMFNKIIRFITHIKTFANIIYFLFSVSNQIPSFLPTVIPVWPVLIAYEDYLFNYSNPAQDINTVFGLDINHHADTDSDTPTFRTPNILPHINAQRRNAIIPGNIVPQYNSGRFSGRIGSSRFERLFFASYYTRIDDQSASDNDNEENDNEENDNEHNIYNSHQHTHYTLLATKKCTLCGLRRHNIRSCTHPAIDACVEEGKYLYIQAKLNTNEDTKNKMHTWRKTLSAPMMKAIFYRHSAIATTDPDVSTMTAWYNKYNPNAGEWLNHHDWDWDSIDNCDSDFHNKYALPVSVLITKSKSKKYLGAITHILFKYIVLSEQEQSTDIQPPHALMPLHIINTPVFNKQLESAHTLNTAILTQSSMISTYDEIYCPICLEHTQTNNTIVTNCKHAFCIRCITLHITSRKTYHHLSCAMCRENIQNIHIQNDVPEHYIEKLQKAIIYGHKLNNIVTIQPI